MKEGKKKEGWGANRFYICLLFDIARGQQGDLGHLHEPNFGLALAAEIETVKGEFIMRKKRVNNLKSE